MTLTVRHGDETVLAQLSVPQARQYYVIKRGTKPKTGVPFPLKVESESGIFFLVKFHLFNQYALKLTNNLYNHRRLLILPSVFCE
jgi:hypothetical protein